MVAWLEAAAGPRLFDLQAETRLAAMLVLYSKGKPQGSLSSGSDEPWPLMSTQTVAGWPPATAWPT